MCIYKNIARYILYSPLVSLFTFLPSGVYHFPSAANILYVWFNAPLCTVTKAHIQVSQYPNFAPAPGQFMSRTRRALVSVPSEGAFDRIG